MSRYETVPILADFFEQTAHTRLAWLGMAGAVINARGTVVLIDPLLGTMEQGGRTVSEAGFPVDIPLPISPGDIPRADLVCYTHGDEDHIGRLTAKTLADHLDCRFMAPPPVARVVNSLGIPKERILTAHDFETLKLGALELTVTPALHDWQEENPWQRGDCCGYLVRTPEGSVWHPGDSRLIDELLSIHNVDVLFFDVADVDSHLGPTGSARIAASSGARVLIPYHYWTFGHSPGPFADFNPQSLTDSVEGMNVRIVSLKPGEVLDLPV
jgi:L-ascorbate metabolism protein UlaG (beta-lactamase superfamily)